MSIELVKAEALAAAEAAAALDATTKANAAQAAAIAASDPVGSAAAAQAAAIAAAAIDATDKVDTLEASLPGQYAPQTSVQSTAPTPVPGDGVGFWLDSDDLMLYAPYGGAWVSVGGSAGAPAEGDDEVYGVGWDGALDYPTKNAVYDKIETIGAGGGTTELWLDPGTGRTDGTLTNEAQGLPVILMADASVQTWSVTTWLPTDWTTFTARLWHHNGTSATGDVECQLRIGNRTIGDARGSALGEILNSSATVITVGAEDVLASTTLVTGAANPGELVGFYVRRSGAATGDTLAGTWAVVGIQLTKAS